MTRSCLQLPWQRFFQAVFFLSVFHSVNLFAIDHYCNKCTKLFTDYRGGDGFICPTCRGIIPVLVLRMEQVNSAGGGEHSIYDYIGKMSEEDQVHMMTRLSLGENPEELMKDIVSTHHLHSMNSRQVLMSHAITEKLRILVDWVVNSGGGYLRDLDSSENVLRYFVFTNSLLEKLQYPRVQNRVAFFQGPFSHEMELRQFQLQGVYESFWGENLEMIAATIESSVLSGSNVLMILAEATGGIFQVVFTKCRIDASQRQVASCVVVAKKVFAIGASTIKKMLELINQKLSPKELEVLCIYIEREKALDSAGSPF